jgi:hypothetical protein
MLAVASAQLWIALFLVAVSSSSRFAVFRPSAINQLQLGFFTGYAFVRYLWRVYPNSIEFFDNEISLGGTRFFPWSHVELRASQLFKDRIVVVIRHPGSSIGGDAKMAQVTSALRDRVFAIAKRTC